MNRICFALFTAPILLLTAAAARQPRTKTAQGSAFNRRRELLTHSESLTY